MKLTPAATPSKKGVDLFYALCGVDMYGVLVQDLQRKIAHQLFNSSLKIQLSGFRILNRLRLQRSGCSESSFNANQKMHLHVAALPTQEYK